MQHPADLIYGVDDRPPRLKGLLYGVQWTVIFLPLIVILSVISSEVLGLDESARVLFFQRMLIVTGATMILQTLWGHRFPILDGPATALLLSVVILSPYGMPALQGGMIVGGTFLVILSLSGILKRIERLFTDNVIGVIFVLIAITLLPHLAPMVIGARPDTPNGDPSVFLISAIVVVSIAFFSHWLRGFPKTISMLMGIVLGTCLAGAFGKIDLRGVGDIPWLSLPHPLFPGLPQFSLTVTFTFLIAYMAVIVNSVGSIYSVAEIVGSKETADHVKKGVTVTGLGGILAGLFGGIGSVSYGLSAGVILVTREASRYAVMQCGILLILLALFKKVMAIISLIPAPVVGAAMVVGLAAQFGAAISIFTRSGKGLDGRDYLVIGIPIIAGGIVSILPEGFFNAFPPTFHALLKNGLIVGIVLVMLLEHAFLSKRLDHFRKK